MIKRTAPLLVVVIALCVIISVKIFGGKPSGDNIARTVYIQDHQLLVHGEPFTIKGVVYNPWPVGWMPPPDRWWNENDIWDLDFPMIKEMGANTIRTYKASDATEEALDAAYNNGLYVIMGYWVNYDSDFSDTQVRSGILNGFKDMVRRWKDHPAVLMWAFGNEVSLFSSGDLKDWYTLLQEAAQAAHAEEGESYHPVIGVEAGIQNIGVPELKSDDASLTALDAWGVNSYLGYTFQGDFFEYQSRTNKPLIMTEWGCDVLDARTFTENQEAQAEYLASQWDDIEANLVSNGGVCLGGTLYAWSDEWWGYLPGSPYVHDNAGSWANNNYYDFGAEPNMNEEWFGITSISPETYQKTPRQAYYVLKERWS